MSSVQYSINKRKRIVFPPESTPWSTPCWISCAHAKDKAAQTCTTAYPVHHKNFCLVLANFVSSGPHKLLLKWGGLSTIDWCLISSEICKAGRGVEFSRVLLNEYTAWLFSCQFSLHWKSSNTPDVMNLTKLKWIKTNFNCPLLQSTNNDVC